MEDKKLENLEAELSGMIVERCKIYDVNLENYDYNAPLFGNVNNDFDNTMQLDSVDALEVVAGIRELYDVIINIDDNSIFYSVTTLADFIKKNK